MDAPFNAKYYRAGHPETEVGSMGLTAYGTVELLRAGTAVAQDAAESDAAYAARHFLGDIAAVKPWLLDHGYIKQTDILEFDQYTKYVELHEQLLIRDAATPERWTPVKKYLWCDDPNLSWRDVTISQRNAYGQTTKVTLQLTADHPLLVAYVNDVLDAAIPPRNIYQVTDPTQLAGCEYFIRRQVDDISLADEPWVLCPIHSTNDTVLHPGKIESILPRHAFTPAVGYDFETVSDRFELQGVVSHNCRTRVVSNIHDPEHEQITGRGNLFFNTINLPYLALWAKEELPANASEADIYHKFMEKLDWILNENIGLSQERFEIAARRHVYNYPFLMGQYEYLGSEKLGPTDSVREVLKNGTQTVGFIGLAETLIAICGHHHGESAHAQELGLQIVGYMNDFMTKKSQETGINYSVMGTPAEGCSGKLLRLTRKRFGIVPGVTDKDYFVNSHHVPPKYMITAWDKIDIEAPYHALEPAC